MLTVETVSRIRREHFVKGKTIREISRDLKVSRNTVRKVLRSNRHDMLTGSHTDGRAYTDSSDHTCSNWTSSGEGSAQVGHSDRTGAGNTSWNSAHPTRGCSQEALVSTGGAGLFYCFAIN